MTRRLIARLCVVAMLVFSSFAAHADETAAQRDARMKWWREARFGMFIHWGVYSVPAGRWNGKPVNGAGEWLMHDAKIPLAEYQQLPEKFNPVKFDADRWVQIAQDAGMKYIVITAKHHDGFAMFHSGASAFNIFDATPFKRDPLKELADACQRHGIKLGFYYSQAQDWNHAGGAAYGGHWDKTQDGSMDRYIQTVAVPQVRELLTNYGPVAVLWWDTPVDMTPARAAPLSDLLSLQPDIITNDRLGVGEGDTNTPEQHIPSTGIAGRDWETCMTINETWGFKSDDTNFKSTEVLLHNLIDIASKGGNYLLNVGPTSLGEIPPPEVDRLKQIGKWLTVNGEAIYGTSASPFRRGVRWAVHGERKPVVSARVSLAERWDSTHGVEDESDLGNLPRRRRAANMRSTADVTGAAVLTIQPPAHPDALATVVALNLAGSPTVDNTADALRPAPDGTLLLAADDATIHGSHAQMEGDHVGYWTDASDSVSWDLALPTAADYVVELNYACEDSAAGSEYSISSGASSASGKINATEGWRNFVTNSIGQVRLNAGKQTVTVTATKMPNGAVMNLRSIRLIPAR